MDRNTAADTVVVIGAGIIGLCSALSLRRMGASVVLIDQLPPGQATSFGNAGLISVESNTPVALPGMLKQVPKWLMNPLGPLAVRPTYAWKASPWLMRWVRAGGIERVREASDALRAMHTNSFERYKDLLGEARFRDLMRQSGGVSLYDGEEVGTSEKVTKELQQRHGIEVQALTHDDLKQMFPGIDPAGQRGFLLPRNGYTVSPQRLTRTLADLFQQEGGTILQEKVLKLLPDSGRGYTILTNIANHQAAKVLIAGGAWSKQLLKPLGIRLPLESERGYHYHMFKPSLELRLPIAHRSRGFAITPMEDGLRMAGTVEIGGLDAAPNEKRALVLRQQTELLFPGLKHEASRIWMGHRPSLPDSVPAVGPVPGHAGLYIAAGHGHTGMIAGSTTGKLIAEVITGRPPHIDPKPYRMDRFGII